MNLDIIGDYIGSGATGFIFEHTQEPDKVIKIMKAFPAMAGGRSMNAFQYHTYLENRNPKSKLSSNYHQEDWLWSPMTAKMVMFMFEEIMAYRAAGRKVPSGIPQVYDVSTETLPLSFARDLHSRIDNKDGAADYFDDLFLSIQSPKHRRAYIAVMEAVGRIGGRSRAQPRSFVFSEVTRFLWDDMGLVTRDTKNPENYGFRPNGELVLFDPVVSPLPDLDDWKSKDVNKRLRYAYYTLLFTSYNIPVVDASVAEEVNKKIRVIDRQFDEGRFYTVERDAESFDVEGFPGSFIPEPALTDWGVRDMMYSSTIEGNFLEDQAKFSYGLGAEDFEAHWGYRESSSFEVYVRKSTGMEKIIYRAFSLRDAIKVMCAYIAKHPEVYEVGIYGTKTYTARDPVSGFYGDMMGGGKPHTDLLVRWKYGDFSGNDQDAVALAKQLCGKYLMKHYGMGGRKMKQYAAPAAQKVKFPRAKADKIVAQVEAHMKPMVDRILACGSYRRGAEMIGDIDFVLIPKKGYTLPNMLPPNQGVNWVGDQKAQIIIDGEKVDFRVATPEAWGATVLYFTGPAEFNIKYRVMAKKQGKKLSEYGVFNRDTNVYLVGKTEEDVFTELGRPYKEPKDRQGWKKKKAEGFGAEEDSLPRCPICYGHIPNDMNPGAYPGALARYDNETEICSDCGTAEALVGMFADPEDIQEYEENPSWEGYAILITNVKGKMPEVMFGRGPEWDALKKANKKNGNFASEKLRAASSQYLHSEALIQEIFDKRYGWNVGDASNLERRVIDTPVAINLGRHNFKKTTGFEGLGSLFGSEDPDDEIDVDWEDDWEDEPEPDWEVDWDAEDGDKIFGVQRHDAHRAGLHYDLRLERDGVLKSWSIPKGMPTSGRHLAIATPDHKMSWLEFEGDIPEGSYGAGNVKLDNKSTFKTISYSNKKWVFFVNTGKYKGKYILVHWKDNKWLITRNKDQSLASEEVFNAGKDPISWKQKRLIADLGGDPDDDLNRRQASRLIVELLKQDRAIRKAIRRGDI